MSSPVLTALSASWSHGSNRPVMTAASVVMSTPTAAMTPAARSASRRAIATNSNPAASTTSAMDAT